MKAMVTQPGFLCRSASAGSSPPPLFPAAQKPSHQVWDLAAAKLVHGFRVHECPDNCLDVHPHEFLLATGSVDKTVNFGTMTFFSSLVLLHLRPIGSKPVCCSFFSELLVAHGELVAH